MTVWRVPFDKQQSNYAFWLRQKANGKKVEDSLLKKIRDQMPKEIRDVISYMSMAKAYNHLTGANLTHWDMVELGIHEETILSLAMKTLLPDK